MSIKLPKSSFYKNERPISGQVKVKKLSSEMILLQTFFMFRIELPEGV